MKRPLALALLALFLVLAQGHRPLAETRGPAGAAPHEAASRHTTTTGVLVLGFGGLPTAWKPLTFARIKRHTTYTIKKDREGEYLAALSSASASALYLPLDMEPGEYPVLSWRWKIRGVLRKGDARTKAGDDYAARIYVTFARDPGPRPSSRRQMPFWQRRSLARTCPGARSTISGLTGSKGGPSSQTRTQRGT